MKNELKNLLNEYGSYYRKYLEKELPDEEKRIFLSLEYTLKNYILSGEELIEVVDSLIQITQKIEKEYENQYNKSEEKQSKLEKIGELTKDKKGSIIEEINNILEEWF